MRGGSSLQKIALGALASALLSSPGAPAPMPRAVVALRPSVADLRAVAGVVDGFSVASSSEPTANGLVIRVVLRNAGPRVLQVGWPKTCEAGARVVDHGDVAVIARVRGLPPWKVRSMHDWEASPGFAVLLEPGQELTETIVLPSAAIGCAGVFDVSEGAPTEVKHVLLAYQVGELMDESNLGREHEGRRMLFHQPRWTLVVSELAVPPSVRLTRGKGRTNVERTWSVSPAAPAAWDCRSDRVSAEVLVEERRRPILDAALPAEARALRAGLSTATPGRSVWETGYGIRHLAHDHAHEWELRVITHEGREQPTVEDCPGPTCVPGAGDVIAHHKVTPGGLVVTIRQNARWLATRFSGPPTRFADVPEKHLAAVLSAGMSTVSFACGLPRIEWVREGGAIHASTAFDRPWSSVRSFWGRADFWVEADHVDVVVPKWPSRPAVRGYRDVPLEGWFEEAERDLVETELADPIGRLSRMAQAH